MGGKAQSVVVERVLTQQDFDSFAMLSGDDNPIHVDPEFSARTRFGRTVAHGMLLATVFRGLIDRIAPGTRQVSQDLRFPAPTYADELMRFSVTILDTSIHEVSVAMDCRRSADEVVTCSGSAVLLREES